MTRTAPSLLHSLIIILAVFALYAGSLHGEFHFDDFTNITENPAMSDWWYFFSGEKADTLNPDLMFGQRWIGFMSFALNHRAHGLNRAGYHAVNISLHAANSLLVYFLVMLILSTPAIGLSESAVPMALASALLYAAHPLQTEAVAYVAQRHTLWAAMFYLSACVMFIIYRTAASKHASRGAYAASILLCALAMFSKQNAFTLPIILVLIQLFLFGRKGQSLLPLLPYLACMAIIPATIILGDSSFRGLYEISRQDYFYTQQPVVLTYLRLILLPAGQTFDYDYPVFSTITAPETLIPALVHLALIAASVLLYRKGGHLRAAGFGIWWFYLTLSVESSFIPLIPIFEHRLYLPIMGLLLSLSAISHHMLDRKGIALLACMALIMAVYTHQRINVWSTEVSLWKDVSLKAPLKKRGQNNLAHAYLNAGMIKEAEEHLKDVISIDPFDAVAHFNLGTVYLNSNRPKEASAQFLAAIINNQEFAEAHNNLGLAYSALGRYSDAIEHFAHAIMIKPTLATALNNIGNAYIKTGQYDKGGRAFMEALMIEPRFDEARVNLGLYYLWAGQRVLAAREFTQALRDNPSNTDARMFLNSMGDHE